MPSTLVPGIPVPAHPPPAGIPSALPAFFERLAAIPGEFIIHDDGYRGRSWRYGEIAGMAQALRVRFRREGIGKGEMAVIWSESRPGWVAALWASILEGIVLVPVDPQSTIGFYRRIAQKVRPRVILRGDRVPEIEGPDVQNDARVWLVSDIEKETEGPLVDRGLPMGGDAAEIVFTSGTTAEPRGVIITHRNLAANLDPIDEQFRPYRKYVRPFAPIRIVNLLPLSHLFGQALTTFVPPLVPASVIFISSTTPQEISRQIRQRKAAMLVAVPKAFDVLRSFIVRRVPAAAGAEAAADLPWPLCWWRFREVHRLFGWKFCCVVSGGAPLPADLEAFWAGLGYAVVQGYGLTETAPVISFNHPFHIHRGTVGKPVPGVDVRIGADGEVLVRGDNVSPGYFHAAEETAGAFREGWLHTGDIGELTPEGHLVIKGRRKEMIVTPEGLKVFPEDVEAVLNRIPGIRDSAVFGDDQVQAALVVEPGADADAVVRAANERLEDHQKIRSFSVWTSGDLPRTAATGKLRHREIAEAVRRGATTGEPARDGDISSLAQRYAPGRAIHPDTTLDELGLSSLDRVELLMDIEEKLGTHVDENALTSARTIGDLMRPGTLSTPASFPAWNRTWIARAARRAALAILLPLMRLLTRKVRVSGRENLTSLAGPVIFAANHQSYLDAPLIIGSLPARWRYRIAPAMWKEYFDAYFHPEQHSPRERFVNGLLYQLLALVFNAYPVPQTEAGALDAVRYTGELVEEGWSILIFPEGERTMTGEIGGFRPGVGMMASRLGIPVVPIRLLGVDRVWPRTAKWPRFFGARSGGAVEVTIGAAIRPTTKSYEAVAEQVEQAVRRL